MRILKSDISVADVAKRIIRYCQGNNYISVLIKSNNPTDNSENNAILFYEEGEKVIYGISIDREYISYGNVIYDNDEYYLLLCTKVAVNKLNENEFWKAFFILKAETEKELSRKDDFSQKMIFDEILIPKIAEKYYWKRRKIGMSYRIYYPFDNTVAKTAKRVNKTSEAKLKSNSKWNKENTLLIGVRAKTAEVEEYMAYAEKMGISTSKFARAAMKYCIRNKISKTSLMRGFQTTGKGNEDL